MEGSVGRRWLSGLLVVLILIAISGFATRWINASGNKLSQPADSALAASYQSIRDRSDSVGGNWLRTLDPGMKDVQGDLIWNSELQQGVMRFINLPAPTRNQRYRLWIHDSRAADSQPILASELVAGSGNRELFASITPRKTIVEPFKFLLTMGEAGHTQLDSQIMLMVQP